VKDDDSYEVALGPALSDGSHIGVRRRNGELEPIRFGGMKDGAAIPPGAEVVDVDAKSDGPWRKAKTLYRVPLAAGDGPAQVATPAYRSGYDRIFGKKEVGLA
jgi:hypothetical protein